MKKVIILSILLLAGWAVNAQITRNINLGSARFISRSNPSFSETVVAVDPEIRNLNLFYYYRADSTEISDTIFTVDLDPDTLQFDLGVWEYDSMEEALEDQLNDTPIVDLDNDPSYHVIHPLAAGKIYVMRLRRFVGGFPLINVLADDVGGLSDSWVDTEEYCPGCLGGFEPTGGVYILSAWVMDRDAALGTVDYDKPHIEVTSGGTSTDCYASGEIIDGWQRVEKEVVVEEGESVEIELVCDEGGNCLFDDIRFFPKDGSMVTYVYDPITLRLMAELDERNYAKIYEYDEQGKLIRVKKETEMGIMTIQENRENNSKE